jgi:hypothetical protein
MTELEATVTAWRNKGLDWVNAKLKSDLIEKDKDCYLASLIGVLRKADPEASDTKLKAEALASQDYRDFINGMVLAKHKELTARVEYDALDKLFSARQSDQSMERAKLEHGIYHTGGK